jgi:hypothetical protein
MSFTNKEYADMAVLANQQGKILKVVNGNLVLEDIVLPPKTQEEILSEYTTLVQQYLDSTAKSRGYDNILSLCTYATSTVEKFRREGQAGVEWRDAVWSKCYEILEEIQAGNRGVPEDIISELPVFTWGE